MIEIIGEDCIFVIFILIINQTVVFTRFEGLLNKYKNNNIFNHIAGVGKHVLCDINLIVFQQWVDYS